MSDTVLERSYTTEAGEQVKDILTLSVEGTTLCWSSRQQRLEGTVWYVKGRNEGEQHFERAEAAEEALQATLREREALGYILWQKAASPASLPPSCARPVSVKPPWLASLPKHLLAQAAKHQRIARARGLAHRFDEISSLFRPGMDLTLRKATPGDLRGVLSRVGGAPDLPPTEAWPTLGGAPLTFIAQLVLSSTTLLDLEGRLPQEGVLSFFAQRDEGRPDYGERGIVLQFPTADGLVRTAPPSPAYALKTAGVLTAGVLTAKSRLMVAPTGVPSVEGLGLNQDEAGAYQDHLFRESLPPGRRHLLLGWADAATHHDAKGRCFLAQFDSDPRVGFQMGDDDTLRFYLAGDRVDGASVQTAVCTLSEG